MMKKNDFTLLIIVLIIVILGVVGYFAYKNNSSKLHELLTVASITSSSTTCPNYEQFLSTVKNLVSKSVDNTSDNPDMKDGNFFWTRKSIEPMVTYPAIKEYHIFQGNAKTNGSNSAKANAQSASIILTDSLNQEANKLGLINNPLNTTKFLHYSGVMYRKFGFTKNEDLYSVFLFYSPNHGAYSGMDIGISCARVDKNYNMLYDSLSIKLKPPSSDNYYDYQNYISIVDVSSDGRVFGIFGSSNYVDIENYYYFDGKEAGLLDTGSSPIKCVNFETRKVGKGIRCWDHITNKIRQVTY